MIRYVVPYSERKSLSTEHTFAQDSIDVENMRSIISRNGGATCVSTKTRKMADLGGYHKIRYANFDTETKQCRISHTSADHTLLKYALELFKKLYTRRMRLRLIESVFRIGSQQSSDAFIRKY